MDRWILMAYDECGDEVYITEKKMPRAEDDEMELDIEILLDNKIPRIIEELGINPEITRFHWENRSAFDRQIISYVNECWWEEEP